LDPQYTTNINTSYLDEQDGQIIFYRIGVKAGDFTAGPINCTLSYAGGTGFTNQNQIDAYVLQPFGSLLASKDWELGEWSQHTGFPSTVDIHENRLWFAGNDRIYGSVSDNYESFDDETEGDSGPINRNIGSGPIRIIHWAKSFGRLLLGTSENAADVDAARMDGNHPLGVRSSSFDEALTPTNFNIKTIASKGVFVDRTLQRLYELSYDSAGADYLSVDLSIFAPDYNDAGIKQIAVQMKPDVRIHKAIFGQSRMSRFSPARSRIRSTTRCAPLGRKRSSGICSSGPRRLRPLAAITITSLTSGASTPEPRPVASTFWPTQHRLSEFIAAI
jgi:hypothetical protein